MRDESDTNSSSSSGKSRSVRRLSTRLGERLKLSRKGRADSELLPSRTSSHAQNLGKPLPPSPPLGPVSVSDPILESTSSLLADYQQTPRETQLKFENRKRTRQSLMNISSGTFGDFAAARGISPRELLPREVLPREPTTPEMTASPATSFHTAFSHELDEAFASGPKRVQSIPSLRVVPSSQFRTVFPSTSSINQSSRTYTKPNEKVDISAGEPLADKTTTPKPTIGLDSPDPEFKSDLETPKKSHACVEMSIEPLPLPSLSDADLLQQQSHSALPISFDNFAVYKASMQHLDNMRRVEIRSLRERIRQLEEREQKLLQDRGSNESVALAERIRGLPRVLPIGAARSFGSMGRPIV